MGDFFNYNPKWIIPPDMLKDLGPVSPSAETIKKFDEYIWNGLILVPEDLPVFGQSPIAGILSAFDATSAITSSYSNYSGAKIAASDFSIEAIHKNMRAMKKVLEQSERAIWIQSELPGWITVGQQPLAAGLAGLWDDFVGKIAAVTGKDVSGCFYPRFTAF